MHRVVLSSALLLMGCTQGTTPDCTTVQCGPNLDATVGETGSMDAPAETSPDSGDAGSDAPVDAPNDAPKEGG